LARHGLGRPTAVRGPDAPGASRGAQGLTGSLSAAAAAPARAETSSSADSADVALTGNPFVVPEVQALDEGQQLSSAAWASHESPPAVRRREESQTQFAGLSPVAAAKLAREDFPESLARPAAPPELPPGTSITGYPSVNVAQLQTPAGKRALLESTAPLAVEASPGHREALDLALREAGGSFQPVRPAVGVRIAKHLREGASLGESGVSLTPVNARGRPLAGGEGRIDGASVFYGASGTDTDSAVRPTPAGFELDTLLRSPRSPRTLYFRVGLPQGARLSRGRHGAGPVQVLDAGELITTILTPAAQDASGWPVPVSMALHKDTLTLVVGGARAEDTYPVEVDPEAVDHQLWESSSGKHSGWAFTRNPEGHQVFVPGGGAYSPEYLETRAQDASYEPPEWGSWDYQTHGDSDIYEFTATTHAHNSEGAGHEDHIESFLELLGPPDAHHPQGTPEKKVLLATDTLEPVYKEKTTSICPEAPAYSCSPGSGHEANAVHFQQSATATCGGCTFEDRLWGASVLIYEPPGAVTTEFNTSEPTLPVEVQSGTGRRNNVFDSADPWLSQSQGAFEAIAHGKGTGVAAARLEYEYEKGRWERIPGLEHNYYDEGRCYGVQCVAEESEGHSEGIQREIFTLPEIAEHQRLPNGEDHIRWRAESMAAESQSTDPQGEAIVKVETSKPHGIQLNGLPASGELSERPYEVEAQATDGESPLVAASGIRRISLFLKGNPLETRSGPPEAAPEASGEGFCTKPKGECSAHAKFTIPAESLGQGPAQIVVEAENYAGNKGRESFSVTVHHSAPVSLGPGALDLQSGDFSLGSTDVSEGTGLSVSRSFSSRDTSAGAAGPLGPQWLISMGGGDESLKELYGGAVELVGADGKEIIFMPKETTNSEGKTEYVYNAKTGELEYESPQGDANIDLTAKEEPAKSGTKVAFYLTNPSAKTQVKFAQPTGSPEGDTTWVPSVEGGGLETNTTTFAYRYVAPETTEYALPEGQKPYDIAQGPEGDLWETNPGANTIDQVTLAGKVTEHGLPSGSYPFGITRGPDGNLWFTDLESSKIGKITPAGKVTEYPLLTAGAGPNSITQGPEGDLWFTECYASKIGRITTSGEVSEYPMPAGAGNCPGYLTEGPGNEMWYTDYTAGKVGYVNPSNGDALEYALPNGASHPNGIAAGSEGDLWIAEQGIGKLAKMAPNGTVTEYALPEGFGDPIYITDGPDGNLWFTNGAGPGSGTPQIGKIVPSTGKASAYALPSGSSTVDIISGPDRALWYTNEGRQAIGKLSTGGSEPVEALAPKPEGAECPENGVFTFNEPVAEAKERGCRALTFVYATKTSAASEAEGEWGSYKGQLEAVSFVAWNPKAKKMEAIEVARYAYDKQGRLREQWDPRYAKEPAACEHKAGTGKCLKTLYGYDSEGHVTALSPPGQQPWIMTYGTSKGDASPGRLVKLMRPKATEPLWKGEGAPIDPESQPALEGTPVVGNRMGVSNGVWQGEPAAAYGYQWERCNLQGEACQPIPGAVNQNYTPVEADAGHTLRAHVSAINAGGTGVALSAASALVEIPASEGGVVEFKLPEGSEPRSIAPGADGNVWFTDEATNKVGKITPQGKISEYALPPGSSPYGIAAGSDGNMWFTDAGTGKVGKVSPSGDITEYPLSAPLGKPLPKPEGITQGPFGELWLAESNEGRIVEFTASGTEGSSLEVEPPVEGHQSEGYEPTSITAGPEAYLWFTLYKESAANEIGHVGLSPGTPVSRHAAPTGRTILPYGITAGPDGNVWFTEATSRLGSKIARITQSGEITEYDGPSVEGNLAIGITDGPDGNIWFTGFGASSSEVGKITVAGVLTSYPLPAYSRPYSITTGPDGNLWAAEYGTSYIARVSPYLYSGPTPTPAAEHAPQKGTTIEYGVSVSDSQASAAYEAVNPLYIQGGGFLLGGDTVAKNGDIWVANTGKSRVYQYTPKGEQVGYVGSSEYGFVNAGCSPQMCMPMGVTTDSEGHLWVVNANGYVQEWSEGKRLRQFTASSPSILLISLPLPWGIAVEGGHVFISFEIENVVKEYTESGEYIKTIGSKGSGEGQFESPKGLAVKEGGLFVADAGNDRVDECSIETGSCHTAIDLARAGSGDRHVLSPSALALEASGDIWVADESGNRAVRFSSQGDYIDQYGTGAPAGKQATGPRGIALSPEGGLAIASFENPVLYVPAKALEALAGNEGLQAMDENAVAAWGQEDIPVEATAVIPPTEPQSFPATTYKRATVYYLDEPGQVVNVSSPSDSPYGSVSTTEYNQYHDVVRELSPENRIRSLESGRQESAPLSRLLSTESKYDGEGGEEERKQNPAAASEPGTELVERKGPQHMVRLQNPPANVNSEVLARERTHYYYDREEIYNKQTGHYEISGEAPSNGETFHLLTATQTFADLEGIVLENPQLEVRTTKYSYTGQEDLGWKLRAPTSVTVDPEMQYTKNPLSIKHETLYEPNTGQVSETRGPAGLSGESPHDQEIVYYSAAANHEHAECGERREWAGLTCLTLPKAQPKQQGSVVVPHLPEVRTLAYNIYDQPEVIQETFKTEKTGGEASTTTRTKTLEYDAAGRAKSTQETASAPEGEAKALPEVSYGYSEESGQQISETAGAVRTESVFDSLGQMTEYKDGTGNAAHFEYEEASGLLTKVSDSAPVGEKPDYQRYSYNPITDAPERLEDSQAGTFTATYNGAGQMTSELYPNGVCANYEYNQAEEATHLEYVKNERCKPATNVWYQETIRPSIHGEVLADENTLLASESSFDEAGRPTEVKETLPGKGCSSELFAYDSESNRTKQTKRKPQAGGSCASAGGEEQEHHYDEGNRITDEGTEYNALGLITKTPAPDAGGNVLLSSYYVDGQILSQSQKGTTNAYLYGPSGRVDETTSEAEGQPKKTTISHYDGPGEAVAWTCEGSAGICEGAVFTRNIPGIDGALSAVDEGGKVTIQLHDLKGNIVETAEDSTSASEPLSKQPSSAFGAPLPGEGKPQRFSFLGAAGIKSELPESGVLVQGGTAYVPQSAITLQAEGAPPPGLPEGSGPLVSYALALEPWNVTASQHEAEEAPGLQAARAREAAAAGEEEGDPCTTKGEVGRVYIENPNEEKELAAKAEATLHWCWNTKQKRVFDAYWVPGSLKHQGFDILLDSASLRFDKWEYQSNFIRGRHEEGYRAIVTAVFSVETLPGGPWDALASVFIHAVLKISIQFRIWDNGAYSRRTWNNSCVELVVVCV
jgi:streptogramin lyase